MKQKKYILIVFVFLVSYFRVTAQIGAGGIPPSFINLATLRSDIPNYEVVLNHKIEDLHREDEIESLKGLPPRYAVVIPIDINIKENGSWLTLPNSVRLWRQSITAKGATGLILSYSDFYIPKGGKLFIYNEDKSQVLGSYSHETHPQGGCFSTEVVLGEKLTLEYVASSVSDEEPRITIQDVGYVYHFNPLLRAVKITEYPINTASCSINVNCDEGSNWIDQKRGVVCFLIKLTPARWVHCTGSLINNTARDGKPYVITASHNLTNAYGLLSNFIFYFNYEFPTCSNEDTRPSTIKTLVGCELLVDIPLKGGSDVALLKIKDVTEIPSEWKPYYNGWDISDTPSLSGAIIHHPMGDVKKITMYNAGIQTGTVADREGAIGGHWRVVYDGKSVTHPASSGAPLFSEKGLILGTLTGGNTNCDERFLPEYYGKMSYSWDKYVPEAGNPHQKLKPYLDPIGANVRTLTGHDPNNPVGIMKDDVNNNLIIFTDQSILNINASSIITKLDIYSMSGQRVYTANNLHSSTTSFSIVGWATGIYQIVVQTYDSGRFTKRFIKK